MEALREAASHGKAFKRWREVVGVSVATAALCLSVSERHLDAIEAGRRSPSNRVWARLLSLVKLCDEVSAHVYSKFGFRAGEKKHA